MMDTQLLFPITAPTPTNTAAITKQAGVVDMFCGVGGLTHGFVQESFRVLAGYDLDESCQFAFEHNNQSPFVQKDIKKVTSEEIKARFAHSAIKILVGCAPCQPFSSYNFKNEDKAKWSLLNEFARLIREVQPDIVSMENVPQLLNFKKEAIFQDFLQNLIDNQYFVSYKKVECTRYGIPQNRKRLVLLASKLGAIELIPPTHEKHNFVSVRQTIGNLEPLESGAQSSTDALHKTAKLSSLNIKRIQQSVPGRTWRDWDKSLILKCHQKDTGKSYMSVYGRMLWDEPSPTITTQFNGIGNGRFGHPEQDRALSLREGALLQTFPPNYEFIDPKKSMSTGTITTHIGNAVPVRLGQIIAKSILIHLENYWKHE
jgi:DNA (cytosine-5)-methyltransferase 1